MRSLDPYSTAYRGLVVDAERKPTEPNGSSSLLGNVTQLYECVSCNFLVNLYSNIAVKTELYTFMLIR